MTEDDEKTTFGGNGAMSAKKDLLLAIDQGTQSVRAMLFDRAGEMVAKSQVHITPYYSRAPGWAEQDCDYFWANLCHATRELWLAHPGLRERVAAMAVTTQRAVVVLLGADREPLRPAIIWLDQRRTRRHAPLPLDRKSVV